MTVVRWFGNGRERKTETQLSGDPLGRDELHYAAADGDVRTLKSRIAAGADVNQAERSGGFTPLYFAVESGELKTATLLLNAGADLEARSEPRRMTPLFYAVMNWRASPDGRMIKLLLARGADLTARDKNGMTPYDAACGIVTFPSSLIGLLVPSGEPS